MDKKVISYIVLISIVLSLVLLPFLGCTKATAPVKTKPDKIVLHAVGDLSGLYGRLSAPLTLGWADAIEWYNQQGGVQGVPLDLVYRDTGGKLDQTMAGYAAMMESSPRPIVVMTFVSADSEALRDRVIEDKVVGYAIGGTSKAIYPAGYTIGIKNGYSDEFGAFTDWVTGDWANKTGVKPVVAILAWEGSFGRAIMTPETKKYAADKGLEIVAEEYFPPLYTVVNTQLTKLKATRANWIYAQCIVHGIAAVTKGAKAMDMLPNDPYDTSKIHVFTTCPALDESAATLAGEAFTGLVGCRNFVSFAETDNKGVQLISSIFEAKGSDPNAKNGGYLSAWATIPTLGAALNRVVETDGWDGLKDGSALRREMLKTKDFSPVDLTLYTLTPEKPEPIHTRIMYVKEGGRILPITPDYITCPDLKPVQQ